MAGMWAAVLLLLLAGCSETASVVPSTLPAGSEADVRATVQAVLAENPPASITDPCVQPDFLGTTQINYTAPELMTWTAPTQARRVIPGRVEPAPARELARAMAGGLRQQPDVAVSTLRQIPAGWVAPPQHLCRPSRQDHALALYRPVFVGEIAFLEVTHICPVCGNGELYALKRDGARWTIVGASTTWIS